MTTPAFGTEDRRSILVVEDDPAALRTITRALDGIYRVGGAARPDEAWAALRDGFPDLLILDVCLGKESGLDLLQEYRQRSAGPVLVITGQGSEEVVMRALNSRASAYLSKPFSVAALRQQVATLLAEGPRTEHVAELLRYYLDQHFAEPLSATDMAAQVGVRPRHLTEIFRGRFGRSPLEYLREVRLRQAEQLLVLTHLAVHEIAGRVGFRHPSYFDRAFKEAFGMTPVLFRRTHAMAADPDGSRAVTILR